MPSANCGPRSSRITVTVVFNRLDYEAQCAIAERHDHECAALGVRGFVVTPEPAVSDIVIQRGYHERLGARPMRDATELLVRNALAHDLPYCCAAAAPAPAACARAEEWPAT